jgi:hypothetical protein
MGRRKITIRQIVDPKLRHITFNKRKNGLIKKAAELSLLCNVNMLLIFEDGNGNLIQFSKNKLVNIPSFFQECRYSNVLEFNAKDYPNFFKVNHYKKHKHQDMDDFDQDDMDLGDDMDSKNGGNGQMMSQGRVFKRERLPGASHIKEEDRDSSKLIYQSGSDESSDGDDDELAQYTEIQPVMQKKKAQGNMKTKKVKSDEKPQKIISNDDQINGGSMNEQETPAPQKESFQSFKEVPQRVVGNKPMDYNQQFMGFEHPFKRNTQVADPGNSPFRFYPTDNSNAANPNANFVNNPNYMNTNPYMPNGYPNGPNVYPNAKANPRLRGIGNINMGNMANMSNVANMTNEETLNAMLKAGLGFAIGGANPFINKQANKPEMDEKLIDNANMIKYLNGIGANGYPAQKMYNFLPPEAAGKAEDAEAMAHLRNNHEGLPYDHEHEYHEIPPQYVRGFENNIPSNLPSAYFSSKKFNFDGYSNTFEDDRFNGFRGETKRKLKQGQ